MRRKLKRGFTLIELLVVLGILAVLLGVILIAVNPTEQIGRASDTSAKAVIQDYIKANIDSYSSEGTPPWVQNASCQQELENAQTLSDIPTCTGLLINDTTLEADFRNSNDLDSIHVSKCGKSVVLCYSPKSKIEYEGSDVKYDKFGVVNPGCPGKKGEGQECYWCKPVISDPQCLQNTTPTPTIFPTSTPIPSATPTNTPVPTNTPSPRPTIIPTNAPSPTPKFMIGDYLLDQPKFLRTYVVLAFDYPGFPPNWMVDVSMRPDFGGTTSTGFGYFVGGVPVTSSADTIFNVAYVGDGNFGTLTSPSYAAQIALTQRKFGFISMPYYWTKYTNGCGQKIYWRVVGWPGKSTGLIGPTQENTIDCTTQVGIIPSNQLGVLPGSDLDGNGVYNYTDYIIAALWSKFRAGGWQPPE